MAWRSDEVAEELGEISNMGSGTDHNVALAEDGNVEAFLKGSTVENF